MTTQTVKDTIKGSRSKSPFLVTFGDGETFSKKPDASTKFVRVASKANPAVARDFSLADLEVEIVMQLAAKGLAREQETKLRNDLDETDRDGDPLPASDIAAQVVSIADEVYKRIVSGQVSAKRSEGTGGGKELDYEYYADVMSQLMKNTGNSFDESEREDFISHLRDDCDKDQRKAFILEMSRVDEYKKAKAQIDLQRSKGKKTDKNAGSALMQKLQARIAKSKTS